MIWGYLKATSCQNYIYYTYIEVSFANVRFFIVITQFWVNNSNEWPNVNTLHERKLRQVIFILVRRVYSASTDNVLMSIYEVAYTI
jgi:hypothetical protein